LSIVTEEVAGEDTANVIIADQNLTDIGSTYCSVESDERRSSTRNKKFCLYLLV
jgi:hypothetical protein